MYHGVLLSQFNPFKGFSIKLQAVFMPQGWFLTRHGVESSGSPSIKKTISVRLTQQEDMSNIPTIRLSEIESQKLVNHGIFPAISDKNAKNGGKTSKRA